VQSKLFTKAVIVDYVELRDEITFYSQYPLIIPYLSLLFVLLTIMFYLINRLFPNVLARLKSHENN
jgi:hypothetical protein